MLKKRHCEICGELVGEVSDGAWEFMHRHCDDPACMAQCPECVEDEGNEDYVDEMEELNGPQCLYWNNGGIE